MLRGEKNLAENFDEEWFDLLKRIPSSDVLQGSKLLQVLKDLSKINSSESSARIADLLTRFNNIFLYHEVGKKFFRVGPPLRGIVLYLTNNALDPIGIGPMFKQALTNLEAWFMIRSRKLRAKENKKLIDSLEQFTKILEGE